MRVTVQLFAQLRQVAGKSTLTVEVAEPCTAQDVVTRLAGEHGERFRDLVFAEEGGLRPSVLLFVGDDRVAWEAPRDLRDRDTVLLATPIAGG